MKKWILSLFVLSFSLFATQSKASNWGCEVLLCLAASGGSPSECKPPLKKLFKKLALGASFPTCEFKNASGAFAAYSDYSTDRGKADYVREYTYCSSPGKKQVGHGKNAKWVDVCNGYSTVPGHWDYDRTFFANCWAKHPKGFGRKQQEDNTYARNKCLAPISKTEHYLRVKTVNGWGDYHRYTY